MSEQSNDKISLVRILTRLLWIQEYLRSGSAIDMKRFCNERCCRTEHIIKFAPLHIHGSFIFQIRTNNTLKDIQTNEQIIFRRMVNGWNWCEWYSALFVYHKDYDVFESYDERLQKMFHEQILSNYVIFMMTYDASRWHYLPIFYGLQMPKTKQSHSSGICTHLLTYSLFFTFLQNLMTLIASAIFRRCLRIYACLSMHMGFGNNVVDNKNRWHKYYRFLDAILYRQFQQKNGLSSVYAVGKSFETHSEMEIQRYHQQQPYI